jgi:hypothetical protein
MARHLEREMRNEFALAPTYLIWHFQVPEFTNWIITVEYRGHIYRGGLVKKTFSYHQLRLATPTAEELHVFGQSQGVEASVMATSWSKDSVAAMAPDAQVRIVLGEQSGLTGHILSIVGDTCRFRPESPPWSIIDVPLADIHVHFSVGDYVRVKTGIFAGSVGWVAQVEQRPDVDIVTFIDEASMKEGEPKEVSMFRFVVTTSYLTVFCRLHRPVSSSKFTILPLNQLFSLMVLSPKKQHNIQLHWKSWSWVYTNTLHD